MLVLAAVPAATAAGNVGSLLSPLVAFWKIVSPNFGRCEGASAAPFPDGHGDHSGREAGIAAIQPTERMPFPLSRKLSAAGTSLHARVSAALENIGHHVVKGRSQALERSPGRTFNP